ncbi:MFS general substrate transporter [Mytilinidion resinicola]|uniref:MFS general substrate transporter n=1 Tax=Mytilinidion resinicola TaxID=574789 RepID=A0A6A6YGF5_9PEZI|nr:MFS general substrate transporter [Mytilinidion resinicola]KAF2806977.1 MFS general substrate transporter [Mytilinidion resinicola]
MAACTGEPFVGYAHQEDDGLCRPLLSICYLHLVLVQETRPFKHFIEEKLRGIVAMFGSSEKNAFDGDSKQVSPPATEADHDMGSSVAYIDKAAEKSYGPPFFQPSFVSILTLLLLVRKLDFYLLPFLSLMYFFNSVDRSNLGNAKTDGMDKDLHFIGEEYSLLILLFYIPNGLCDLPLNMLTKKWSGKIMLPGLMVSWGACALLQCAAYNFAGMVVLRLFLGAFEAGFFAGTVFYLTLFYTRGELGFRIAIFFGSALLAAAFSGLISYGVFQINDPQVQGWKFLFIIEGAMTVLIGTAAFWWLPATPSTAWFLTPAERAAARARSLRDSSSSTGVEFSVRECFQHWKTWKFFPWMVISFTYPVAFSTTANFLPQIVARLGYSVVKTNLWTVAPNAVGFVFLLLVTYSSDRFRERTFHIVFALLVSGVGMVILATIDVLANKGVAYFACFMMASGAYIPSCLVHSWHNNNNLNENSRAATTGLLVGLGNLGGILSAGTFRQQYAPKYVPTLIATCCCNLVCIVFTLWLGGWMKMENRRRDREMGEVIRPEDIDTDELADGERSAKWRYFT